MSFFSRWFAPGTASSKRQAQRYRPQVEGLEKREVPTNDIFTVQGVANTQVTLNFKYDARNTPFFDEIGVFTVTDDQGRVAGLLPNDPGYAAAALNTARMVFEAGEIPGFETQLSFTAGTRLAFYIIRNNTLDRWELTNPNNKLSREPQAFFSIQLGNNDDIDHVRAQTLGDGTMKMRWENGTRGGDRDFNDDIVSVSYATQDGLAIPGVDGQTISARFKYVSGESARRSEVGLFLVDDITGRIGTLSPGDPGWAKAALTSASQQVLFPFGSRPGAVKTVQLPAGEFYGMYIIQGGTKRTFLSFNPNNTRFARPMAHFTFQEANIDGRDHVRWFSRNTFGFEDSLDPRHRDFNDFVGRVRFNPPANTAPFVKGSGLADITTGQNAADRTIDLAGFFDDRDLTNSRVRVRTNYGDVIVELFDRSAPRTVANFFNYIKGGDYNSSIFHRSADTVAGNPFVLQGGGFQFDPNADPKLVDISGAGTPTVQNEFGASNVRGTLAMAKLDGNPNSATSEWFVNLGNNSANLDGQNGGFTVFGQVLDGMKIVDKMANLPIRDFSEDPNDPNNASWPYTALGELPLRDYTGTDFPNDTTPANYAFIQNIAILKQTEFLTYSVEVNVTEGAADIVTATVVDNRLNIQFANSGTGKATITVTATDKAGKTVTDSFNVTVQ
jgi:cyclophilin family peptidyl-prolyl cis-trans isomerase